MLWCQSRAQDCTAKEVVFKWIEIKQKRRSKSTGYSLNLCTTKASDSNATMIITLNRIL